MRRIISIAVSLTLLGLIYWKLDFRAVVSAVAASNGRFVLLVFLLIVPIIWLQAVRLRMLASSGSRLSVGEAVRLVLAASVLNLALPSKMGDLAKAFWMTGNGRTSLSHAFSLVVVERISDIIALSAFGMMSYFFLPAKGSLTTGFALFSTVVFLFLVAFLFSQKPASWTLGMLRRHSPGSLQPSIESFSSSWLQLQQSLTKRCPTLMRTLGLSLIIWFLHLTQIYGFAIAIERSTPFLSTMALNVYAVLAGLLPLTFAGIGTRDGALVLLYTGILSPSGAAALGIFCTSRYAVPAIAGIPFFSRYLATVRKKRKEIEPLGER